jgi:tetratricopeptide (TPR) repeat protein
MGLALAARGEGDPAAALRRAIAIKPEALEARAALVDVLTAAGQDASAEIEAARPYGGIGKGYLLLGADALEAGDHDRARHIGQGALAAGSSAISSLLLSLAELCQDREGAAPPTAIAGCDLTRLAILARRTAARLLLRGKPQVVDSLLDFSLAVGATGEDWLLRSKLYHQQLHLQAAAEALRQAEMLAPQDEMIQWALARNALARGDILEAEAIRSRIAVAAAPLALLDDCQLALAVGRAQQVLDWCLGDRGSSLQPGFRLGTQGLALLALGREAEAAEILSEAGTQHQGQTWVLVDLALGLSRLGRVEAAQGFWAQATGSHYGRMVPFLALIRRWIGLDILERFGVRPEG